MIDDEYIAVYRALFPGDAVEPDDPRRAAIVAEMQGVHEAACLEDAADVVAWWEWPCPEFETPLAFATAARARMGDASAPGPAAIQLAALRRFRQFVADVVESGQWEYHNGNDMTADASVALGALDAAIREIEHETQPCSQDSFDT